MKQQHINNAIAQLKNAEYNKIKTQATYNHTKYQQSKNQPVPPAKKKNLNNTHENKTQQHKGTYIFKQHVNTY